MRISVVTVAMNRSDHLVKSALYVSRLNCHCEHIIIDYGSIERVSLDILPKDSRIKLVRVDSTDNKWWLTHSYNLGFALSKGDYIIKLDADVLSDKSFEFSVLACLHKYDHDLLCNRLTLQDWQLPSKDFITNGLFIAKRSALEIIGGFNPYIKGWGWDEIDLYSRIFLSGFSIGRLPSLGVDCIEHDDERRIGTNVTAKNISRLLFKESRLSISPHLIKTAKCTLNREIALASIRKKIKWPDFIDYKNSFESKSILPTIEPIDLFTAQEAQSLMIGIFNSLTMPSRLAQYKLRLLNRLPGNKNRSFASVKSTLDSVGINLSLVCNNTSIHFEV